MTFAAALFVASIIISTMTTGIALPVGVTIAVGSIGLFGAGAASFHQGQKKERQYNGSTNISSFSQSMKHALQTEIQNHKSDQDNNEEPPNISSSL